MRHLKIAALALALASPLAIADAGDWVFKFGAHNVDPKSDSGVLAGTFNASVDANIQPTFTLEYFLTDNWSLEVLAALPFEHDVELDGVKAATTKHLPPTVSFQYYFAPQARVSPYLGLGVNYTRFFSEKTSGPLAGADLALGSSWGLAAHAGIDFRINDQWLFGIDLRKMDIDSDVRLNGADIGSVAIDPLAYGLYLGYRF